MSKFAVDVYSLKETVICDDKLAAEEEQDYQWRICKNLCEIREIYDEEEGEE